MGAVSGRGRAEIAAHRFAAGPWGSEGVMELSLLLIVIGIVLAILVSYAIGIACIVIGLVLLIWPRISGARTSRV